MRNTIKKAQKLSQDLKELREIDSAEFKTKLSKEKFNRDLDWNQFLIGSLVTVSIITTISLILTNVINSGYVPVSEEASSPLYVTGVK